MDKNTEVMCVNPFALVEAEWMHENYHSKILAGLLNAEIGKHALLKTFISYLANKAEVEKNLKLRDDLKKLIVTDNVTVGTEVKIKGNRRIDILIRDDKWAIIIENKIDGAPDQRRQIPDYLGAVQKGKNGVHVVAIVYLKAYIDESGPSDCEGWTKDETEEINSKLIPVAGIKTKENGRSNSLYGGWVHGTAKKIKLGCVQRTLKQYSEILKAQASQIEEDDQIAKEYEPAMRGEEVSHSTTELAGWLARKLERECAVGPFKKKSVIERGRRIACLFEGLPFHGGTMFALEVCCEKIEEKSIRFLVRYGHGIDTEALFRRIETTFSSFGFSCRRLPRARNYSLMISCGRLSPLQLVSKTSDVIAKISIHSGEIEKCLNEVLPRNGGREVK